MNEHEHFSEHYSDYSMQAGSLRKVEILKKAEEKEFVFFARESLIDANSEVYLVDADNLLKVATFT